MKVRERIFSLSALGGGEGQGEMGETPAHAHLTRPPLRGGHPLPPMGGEGLSERADG
jgi:hypothetical protein